jgi:hypothetical protein
MQAIIQIHVHRTEDNHTFATIRKKIVEDGRIVQKFGMTRDGDWLLVREGEAYPDECLFPFTRPNYERRSPFMDAHAWMFGSPLPVQQVTP